MENDTINCQKIIRTGDYLADKKTGQRLKVHYIKEKSGQMSFESQFSAISEIQVDDGLGLIFVPVERLKLLKSS